MKSFYSYPASTEVIGHELYGARLTRSISRICGVQTGRRGVTQAADKRAQWYQEDTRTSPLNRHQRRTLVAVARLERKAVKVLPDMIIADETHKQEST